MKISKGNTTKRKTRKQLRKEKRLEKKAKKNDYFRNKNKPGKFVLLPEHLREKGVSNNEKSEKSTAFDKKTELIKKELQQQQKLQNEMKKNRKKQLLSANEIEDRNIKKLGKQLKLNKRNSKSIPQSFSADGLDYLLEVCELDKYKENEGHIQDLHDDFEEDFDLMTEVMDNKDESSTSENDFNEEESIDEEESNKEDIMDVDNNNLSDTSFTEDVLSNSNEETFENDINNSSEESAEEDTSDHESGTWEDIYGRKRTRFGEIINDSSEKYIPPAIRAKMESNNRSNEKLNKLKKMLKGLLNRLAESNMYSISSQIEDLYMNNSRNDMNETLTALVLDATASHIITPERLLMEHVMLITILHANVGSEVGAHFLQTVAKKFDMLRSSEEMEDKTLDNIVNILSQLYNFKIFNSQLVHEILGKLSDKFDEKSIECILHILKAVGFNLRKDDATALKSLILNLQSKASAARDTDNSRVKFMLDVLLAIKNNNMTKIPNYDNSYSEHLKKVLKGLIRRGNYVTTLNITLEDLLKAEERGKWWVVGSAWTGNLNERKSDEDETVRTSETFSQKLLALAKKQRMNTEIRRNIFCTIMSAEDYMDAFEKLLHLGLKNQQEREIIHVLLHCCLQEKKFNPYYGVLSQKFCDYERKFQMAIKFSVWDKLKSINESSTAQISNLAKLLTHLFLEKGLPISTLKIIQFSELDKVTLRFMRQTLLGILLHDDVEACTGVFERIVQSDKLKMFKDSLRLFIHHFLLKNLKSNVVDESKRNLLEERAKMVDKLLSINDKKIKF